MGLVPTASEVLATRLNDTPLLVTSLLTVLVSSGYGPLRLDVPLPLSAKPNDVIVGRIPFTQPLSNVTILYCHKTKSLLIYIR